MVRYMKKTFRLVLCLALVLASVMGLTACGESGEAVVQSVSMLTGLSISGNNRYVGEIVAQETVEYSKNEDDKISEIFVKSGQTVKKGDPLFSYDTESISLAISQGKLEVQKYENTIASTKKQIKQLEKERSKASKSDRLGYTVEIQSLQTDIKEAEYNISLKLVEVERLEATVSNTDIVSEIDGIVQSVNEKGQNQNGEPAPILVLAQTGSYRVKGTISEQNVYSLPIGAAVIIRSRIDDTQTWTGAIESVDTTNPASQNSQPGAIYYGNTSDGVNAGAAKYPFYVTLDSTDGLMMGQHVYIELGSADMSSGLWLSSAYIMTDEDGASYVWADKNGKLEKRAVTLGESDEVTGMVLIAEGLTPEDYIAQPSEELSEGMTTTKYDEDIFASDEKNVEGEDMMDDSADYSADNSAEYSVDGVMVGAAMLGGAGR